MNAHQRRVHRRMIERAEVWQDCYTRPNFYRMRKRLIKNINQVAGLYNEHDYPYWAVQWEFNGGYPQQYLGFWP
jgi:hypothetical protein